MCLYVCQQWYRMSVSPKTLDKCVLENAENSEITLDILQIQLESVKNFCQHSVWIPQKYKYVT